MPSCGVWGNGKANVDIVQGVNFKDRSGNLILSNQTVNTRKMVQDIKDGNILPNVSLATGNSTFKNTSGILPVNGDPAFYVEYGIPVTGILGKGPQRIVIGKDGSYWYTADHYSTFIQLNK